VATLVKGQIQSLNDFDFKKKKQMIAKISVSKRQKGQAITFIVCYKSIRKVTNPLKGYQRWGKSDGERLSIMVEKILMLMLVPNKKCKKMPIRDSTKPKFLAVTTS
jgi:hypothetical protein